jgi:uncharacterized SAM-binding protein YcdF (DUF218 family)
VFRLTINRRWRLIMAGLCLLIVAFSAVTARLFVWPSTGMPAHVDAIVVLGGQGSRLDLGEQLAAQNRSHFLVLSKGLPWIRPGLCEQHSAALTVICFQPDPVTTQGEAQYTARLAKQHGWRSIVLVTTPDQIWRAELRFGRCFPGKIYGVTTPLGKRLWPQAVGYQWLATAKAEVVNRGC